MTTDQETSMSVTETGGIIRTPRLCGPLGLG